MTHANWCSTQHVIPPGALAERGPCNCAGWQSSERAERADREVEAVYTSLRRAEAERDRLRKLMDDAEVVIVRQRAERDALRALLARMVDLAEFWINREDGRSKSEQEWKTWHACGHGSNAMRDAKAALREGKE